LIPNGNTRLDRSDEGSSLFSCGQGAMLNETVENRCLSAFLTVGTNGRENGSKDDGVVTM
jgi:hypothetical protein